MGGERIRNIVVFVAGTDEEYQGSLLGGIRDAAVEFGFNVSVFACFGGVLANNLYDIGEYHIYQLANLEMFDGAILLTNTIGDLETRAKVCQAVRASGIPAAVLDCGDDPSFYNIRIDNTAAMREIVRHVIEHHGAKTINYISGPMENPEAKERYEAFLSVMAEHNLPVESNRIYFGGFRPIDGYRAAESLLASGLPLPDAIIAANDAMALEAISVLHEHGVRVPEDTIVTGFDFTYYAQHHSPSLTSVSRPLAEAGRAACALLDRIFRGEACEKTVTLSAKPEYQESCGCCTDSDIDLDSYRAASYDTIKRFRTGASLLNRLTTALAAPETPEDCIHTISQYLHEIECDQCCICLCDNWESVFRDTARDTEEDSINGYTEYMRAPLIWQKNSIREVSWFRSADMYPLPPETGGNMSYFFPLHFREHTLGYYIFTNSDFPAHTMLCHSLMMNISQSFENIRKLLHLNNAIRELDRLYVIDPLCDIYNRNGFIRLADQMFRHSMETHNTLMISFIDMDGLKYINDNFGHDEGDFALKKLAEVIRSTQICARFGGDEFITIAEGFTETDAKMFELDFGKTLKEANSLLNKPYELNASIGTYLTTVTENMKLFSLITQADQIMYEQKKRKSTSRYIRR
ncbi:MAG: GGDEF domain-containing protein [Oscillospiraceae bacterium]|nr:GGDEF domain-containing protein [Oscillospiraceae bacterium]